MLFAGSSFSSLGFIPGQVVIYTPNGTNNTSRLSFGTSLYDLTQEQMPPTEDLTEKDGLRLFRADQRHYCLQDRPAQPSLMEFAKLVEIFDRRIKSSAGSVYIQR